MRRTLCIIAVGLLLAGVPAGAHHSPVEVQFDVDNPIALHGVLIRVEWVNPHARIYLAVRSAGGVDEIWLVETGPPSRLMRPVSR